MDIDIVNHRHRIFPDGKIQKKKTTDTRNLQTVTDIQNAVGVALSRALQNEIRLTKRRCTTVLLYTVVFCMHVLLYL